MKTVSNHIRDHMLRGVVTEVCGSRPEKKAVEALRRFDDSDRMRMFWKEAHARRLMGGYRYEQIEQDGLTYDEKARRGQADPYYKRLEAKMKLYILTGNLEYILDIHNYCKLEFVSPTHPDAHFESTERHY